MDRVVIVVDDRHAVDAFMRIVAAEMSNISFEFRFQADGRLECRFTSARPDSSLLCMPPRAAFGRIRDFLIMLGLSPPPPVFEELGQSQIGAGTQKVSALLSNVGAGIAAVLHSRWLGWSEPNTQDPELEAARKHLEGQFAALQAWIETKLLSGTFVPAIVAWHRRLVSSGPRGVANE